MDEIDNIIYSHSPTNTITIFDYLLLIFHFIKAVITSKPAVVLNLPCELQYPYLFFKWDDGRRFINFAESLKKIFHLKLYWTNCPPSKLQRKITFHPTVSWDFIPKNINLLINSKSIKRGKEKVKRLLQLRGEQVRFI